MNIRFFAVGAALAAAAASAHADATSTIGFQGVLSDAAGKAKADGTYAVTFSLYTAPTGGTLVWTETENVTTKKGQFSVALGSVVSLRAVRFDFGPYWLGVKAPGETSEMTPRPPLQAVPVALNLPGLRTETAQHANNIIGGFFANTVAGGAVGSVIGGGGTDIDTNGNIQPNHISGSFSVIAGGYGNVAGDNAAGDLNDIVVGGGVYNLASGGASTISGGYSGMATDPYTSVGGGINNRAGSVSADPFPAPYAVVAGGEGNIANGESAFVGGGAFNTAPGFWSTIAGGFFNTATQSTSIIPGGAYCRADGYYSFAAGNSADAEHDGAFVWADSSSIDFPSTAINEFSARATGGVRFVTAIDGDGTPTAGVMVPAGGGAWSNLSDRNSKTNVVKVDAKDVLARLAGVPMATWSYKTQDKSIRHIGPMAQDFAHAFGVGEDNRHISTVDEEGVALTAIQGLYREVKAKDARINALEKKDANLEARLEALEHAARRK